MKRTTIGLLAIAMIGALVVAAPATARAPAETQVTIKGENGDFQGKVKSSREPKCTEERTIKVMRVRNGPDEKIATDNASKEGNAYKWSTGNTGEKKGRFYAKAPKTSGCAAGKSKTIRVTPVE
ncbi:hypothetical protein HJD18_10080 [Thermoleophilia bacterium SCSIO 60948]|nr:hypothetical protein HJD18_10080 [Thermoleophilia bacterium SCSIO 60948]